ncbi:MAG: type II toxin-antitoxin system CcdA family antitoxin [Candidatus Methanoperedens sp.]|nr:type II toxin-antitoxin system CcdA family antitoxin [Candidatus Methanoperedens sp.]
MADKKKLTLSINSEVIERAKKLGLNLSEITEGVLKISSLNYEDNLATPDKLREVYVDILKKISKILKKWDMHLKIGSEKVLAESTDSGRKKMLEYIDFSYFLTPYVVELWSDYYSYEKPDEIWRLDDENLPIYKFYDPEKIIIDLIDKLYEKANENREILDKLQILKNILELSNLTK